MRALELPVQDVLRNYTPGDGWSWDDEEQHLHSFSCLCSNDPATVTRDSESVCGIPGHYQKKLEAHLAELGRVEQPICLGYDGRVWDGHHRLVAARRLGFTTIPVES